MFNSKKNNNNKATLGMISCTPALGLTVFFIIKYLLFCFRTTGMEYTNFNLIEVL